MAPRMPKSDRDLEDELLYAPLMGFCDPDSEESLGDLEEGGDSCHREDGGEMMMDECSAALVLMSLGASPAAKTFDMMQGEFCVYFPNFFRSFLLPNLLKYYLLSPSPPSGAGWMLTLHIMSILCCYSWRNY
jgi:hypothetical protein